MRPAPLLDRAGPRLATAVSALQRSLGAVGSPAAVHGDLTLPATSVKGDAALADAAVEQRPDVQSRRAAIEEADEGGLRLEIANRYGNPSRGPATEYNETSVTFFGIVVAAPLPVFNTRRGEIQLRKAEPPRAGPVALTSTKPRITARQDVEAALVKACSARAWARDYQQDVLPSLERSRKELEKLFAQGESQEWTRFEERFGATEVHQVPTTSGS